MRWLGTGRPSGAGEGSARHRGGRESAVPKSRIAILVLAMTLGQVALANMALGADEVPFRGSDDGGFELPGSCPDGSLEIVISGTGRATQLGAYTYAASECFDPLSGTFAGTSTMTAANGDEIDGTYEGQVSATTDPNVITYQEELELNGGTGRFTGATGTLQVAGVANLSTLEYGQTLTGTVSRPASP